MPIGGLEDLTVYQTNVRFITIVAHCGRDHQSRDDGG
jgi:hypothetical protein